MIWAMFVLCCPHFVIPANAGTQFYRKDSSCSGMCRSEQIFEAEIVSRQRFILDFAETGKIDF